jgi:hypothetical protein
MNNNLKVDTSVDGSSAKITPQHMDFLHNELYLNNNDSPLNSVEYTNKSSGSLYNNSGPASINGTKKSEFFTYDELKNITELYANRVHNKASSIDAFKNILHIKFLDKNMEHFDTMFCRLGELKNDLDARIFLKIAAIYIGDKDAIKHLFVKPSDRSGSDSGSSVSPAPKTYRPTKYEIKLIIDRLNTNNSEDDFSTDECLNGACNHIIRNKSIDNLDGSIKADGSKILDIDIFRQVQDIEFMESIVKDIQKKTDTFSKLDNRDKNLTYVSDIKIALFRLIIGVAYRSFRPHTTYDHTNMKNLFEEPYKFIELIKLIKEIINILQYIPILNEDNILRLSKIHDILLNKYNEFIKREPKENKSSISTTTTDASTGYYCGILETEIDNNISHIKSIDDLKKYDLIVVSDDDSPNDVSEILKKRNIELNKRKIALPYISFKNRYSQVVIDDNEYNLIKNEFWYDDFFPLVVRAFSIDSDFDEVLYKLLEESKDNNDKKIKLEEMIDNWYSENQEIICSYCRDIPDAFFRITLHEKIIIKQCWDLTKTFLINTNKYNSDTQNQYDYQYDKFGGQILIDLSQYIPFIDEIVGTQYVAEYKLIPSLPQYIGSPVWKFLHAIPELFDHRMQVFKDKVQKDIVQKKMIDCFISFFVHFLKTYPCPYCRNHLNNFVVKNSEILNYPLEYIFIDWNDSDNETIFKLNIDNKMCSIKHINDLRLFLWKFHNAVNSSISDGSDVNDIDNRDSPNTCSSGNQISTPEVVLTPKIDNNNNEDHENKETSSQTNDKSSPLSTGSRNPDYTKGHWPNVNILPEASQQLYNNALNQLIEHRSLFVSIIFETQNTQIKQIENTVGDKNHSLTIEQTISHFNSSIQNIAQNIKKDIEMLDKAILDSGMMQNIYRVVDL